MSLTPASLNQSIGMLHQFTSRLAYSFAPTLAWGLPEFCKFYFW